MKRWRVMPGYWDGRGHILAMDIKDDWEETIKTQWKTNKEKVINDLKKDFGELDYPEKEKRFLYLKKGPWSVVNEHNYLMQGIRKAYVSGYFYPALVASCTLGERILNSLILRLSKYYKSSPHYKEVYRKGAFQDWNVAIEILTDWEILKKEPKKLHTAILFRNLFKFRNPSVHYNEKLEKTLKKDALTAVTLISQIIGELFNCIFSDTYFIPGAQGVGFIKKEKEDHPFVKEFYIPSSLYVGPRYKFTSFAKPDSHLVDIAYPNGSLSDNDFVKLVNDPKLNVSDFVIPSAKS